MDAMKEIEIIYLGFLLVGAMIFVTFRWIRKRNEEETGNPNQYIIDEGVTKESLLLVSDWIAGHGIKDAGKIPSSCFPLGERATKMFEKYSRCVADDGTCVFDRSLLSCPYEFNHDYVRINDDPDNHILMKRNSGEDTIYNVDVDEGDWRCPAVYASSIIHYIVMVNNQLADAIGVGVSLR